MSKKRRTYYVATTNCDCSSDKVALLNDPRKNMYGPRCPNCLKVLGFVCWEFIATVRASSEYEAFQLAFNKKAKP